MSFCRLLFSVAGNVRNRHYRIKVQCRSMGDIVGHDPSRPNLSREVDINRQTHDIRYFKAHNSSY